MPENTVSQVGFKCSSFCNYSEKGVPEKTIPVLNYEVPVIRIIRVSGEVEIRCPYIVDGMCCSMERGTSRSKNFSNLDRIDGTIKPIECPYG